MDNISDADFIRALQKIAETSHANRRKSGTVIAFDGRWVDVIPDGEGVDMVRCYRGSYTPVIGTRVTVERAPDKNSWRVVGIAEDVLGVGTSAPFDMERQGIEVNYPIPLEAINHGLYNLEDGLTLTLFNVFHPTTSGIGFVASTTIDFAPFVPNTLGRWVTVAVAEDGSFHQDVSSVGVFDQDGWIVPANLAIANDRFPVLAVYLRSDTLNWGNEWRTLTKSIQWGSKFIIRIPYSWASSNGGGGGGGEWGTITGTLSDQTDLQGALDSKVDKNMSITPATHPKITYDDKGLVLSGAPLTASDIPSLTGAKIADGGVFSERLYYRSSGTFVKADYPNAKFIIVTLVAGGGAGGGTPATDLTNKSVGSGGAAGGASIVTIPIDDLPSSVTVTVGAGGLGVLGAIGGAGGTSSFGSFASATGGTGGIPLTVANTAVSLIRGGLGGIGTVGDLLIRGNAGFLAMHVTNLYSSGMGGASYIDGSPVGRSDGSGGGDGGDGDNGAGGSGAGSGATVSHPAYKGGKGGDGLIIVDIYN